MIHRQRKMNATVSVDSLSETKYFDYNSTLGRSHGRHQVWFDDPDTLQAKYAASKTAGARGVAFWTADMPDYSLGEGTRMWAAIDKGWEPPERQPK